MERIVVGLLILRNIEHFLEKADGKYRIDGFQLDNREFRLRSLQLIHRFSDFFLNVWGRQCHDRARIFIFRKADFLFRKQGDQNIVNDINIAAWYRVRLQFRHSGPRFYELGLVDLRYQSFYQQDFVFDSGHKNVFAFDICRDANVNSNHLPRSKTQVRSGNHQHILGVDVIKCKAFDHRSVIKRLWLERAQNLLCRFQFDRCISDHQLIGF